MESKVRISSDEVSLLEKVIQEELQKANILVGLGRLPDANHAFERASQIYLEVFGEEADLTSVFVKTASDLVSAMPNLASYSSPKFQSVSEVISAVEPQTDKTPPEIQGLWDFIWKIVTIGG